MKTRTIVVLAIVAMLVFSACRSDPPNIVSPLGVNIYFDEGVDPAYLTGDMIEYLEGEMFKIAEVAGYPSIGKFIRNTVVTIKSEKLLTDCTGIPVCLGWYDGTEIVAASYGVNGLSLGEYGPTYVHELFHAVQDGRGMPYDFDHTDPVWRVIKTWPWKK